MVLALTLAWIASSGASQSQVDLAPSPFDALYQQYAAGDYDVVARTIRTVADVNALNPPEPLKLRKWLGAWSRAKAAYVLELAATMSDMSSRGSLALISEGRLFVISRRPALGASAVDDGFELAWHKAALGVLEGKMLYAAQDLYLDTLERRYTTKSSASPLVRLDPRFVLERGVALEQECWLESSRPIPGASVSSVSNPGVTTQGPPPSPDVPSMPSALPPATMTPKGCLLEGAKRFVTAARAPETAAEANMRLAWLQFQLGQLQGALVAINRADPGGDKELAYWTELFRGRILNGLNRDVDAERAYRAALASHPDAQSANIGLALTLFRLRKVDDARALASDIRRAPTNIADPWWTYLGADARFVSQWIADIRKLVAPS